MMICSYTLRVFGKIWYNHCMNLLEKVEQYVKKHRMIAPGDAITAGVSGGADSVCLFYFLLWYQKKVPFTFSVIHVHHGIRKEAGDDAAFVEALCKEHKIPCKVVYRDIREMAKKMHLSEEEAGRIARYEAFYENMELHRQESTKGNRIAVAHHKNDQAETVLFQLFRGSGLRGIAGIAPVRDEIIRPLLCVERKEIEDFLEKREIPYMTDATNLLPIYARNRVRNQILPIAASINQQVVGHIAQTAELVSEADAYFEKYASDYCSQKCMKSESGKYTLRVSELLKEEHILQRYILFHCLKNITGQKKDLTGSHMEAIEKLLSSNGSRKIQLPYGMCVEKCYDLLSFWKRTDEKMLPLEDTKRKQELTYHLYEGMEETALKELYEKIRNNTQNVYTKWFDYDKILSECTKCQQTLSVRTRLPGDYLVISQNGHRKKLKEFLIEQKIPKEKRDRIPLLVIGNEVLWIIGYRRSESYFVTNETGKILEIQCKEDTNGETPY